MKIKVKMTMSNQNTRLSTGEAVKLVSFVKLCKILQVSPLYYHMNEGGF